MQGIVQGDEEKSASSIVRGELSTSEGSRFLISGGSGFMGSHFIRYLYNRYPDCRIVNYDLLTYAGNNLNIADIAQDALRFPPGERRYIFVQGDICDQELLAVLFTEDEYAAVINFAAESHVDRSIVNAHHFVRTNIQGVHTLLELVRRFRIPKFIQISTDEIYGDIADGYADEESPLRPSNPYAASKASADLLVQTFMKTYRVPAFIVRSSNNFGPYQYPEKLIPLAISSFFEGVKMPMHGTGMQVRSWIHVADFCRALDLVLHSAAPFSIYNLSGTAKTNLEVMHAVGSILGKDITGHLVHIDDRPGADRRYAPDSEKIRRELGWTMRDDFETALASTVAWYQEHPSWWQAIKQSAMFREHYEKQSRAQYF